MKDYSDVDHILLFAFGEGENVNKILGEIADKIAFEKKITIFTQSDMVKAYQFKSNVLIAEQKEGEYISGLGIIRQFRLKILEHFFANNNRRSKTLIIGAPQHIGRCVADFKEECPKFPYIRFSEFPEGKNWYSPQDPQKHVRNPIYWWKQEILVRIVRWVYFPYYAKKALQGRK